MRFNGRRYTGDATRRRGGGGGEGLRINFDHLGIINVHRNRLEERNDEL